MSSWARHTEQGYLASKRRYYYAGLVALGLSAACAAYNVIISFQVVNGGVIPSEISNAPIIDNLAPSLHDVVDAINDRTLPPKQPSTSNTTEPQKYPKSFEVGPPLLAPWDPLYASGGNTRLTKENTACQADLLKFCQDRLPLRSCLEHHKDLISSDCQAVLDPCKSGSQSGQNNAKSEACKSTRQYQTALDVAEATGMERILQRLDKAATSSESVYWMAAGSGIGGLLHHGRIPWDDDIDVYVPREQMESLFQAFDGIVAVDRLEGRIFKIFEPNATLIPKTKWGWPNIDLFPVDCNGTHCVEGSLGQRSDEIEMPQHWIFPLVRRPFGRLSLSFPNKLREIIHSRYSPSVAEVCVIGGYIHSKERFLKSRKSLKNCTDLYFNPVFTKGPETPWQSHPEFTVEHLIDGDAMLCTVIFDRGNEVRRSYADGLLGVDGNRISFTIAMGDSNVIRHPSVLRPVPFLLEERICYLRNYANRSARVLNLEVMPMLDRVEVSNEYDSQGPKTEIQVVAWNAERGSHWHILRNFTPDPDILILNEMDWGMARSGNVHTTPLLANSMRMNYAYGIEFMELTNGNEGEINATLGNANTVGYHGNVVMSKWPITETKVVRLHELYDHLYKEKTTGMDRGERRLGGRMALFAVTSMDRHKNLLVVSAHGHGGAPRGKLKGDARLICREIEAFSTRVEAIFLGGDVSGVLVEELYRTCGTLPLRDTNNYRGNRAVPTWRVTCKDGGKPFARFERGDWLIARNGNRTASSGMIQILNDTVQTVHPYKRLPNGKYECVSDHSIIMFTALL